MRVVVILEEQPGGDIKCGLVTEGYNDATKREQVYAGYFMGALKHVTPHIVELAGGKEIIPIPGRNAEN